MTTGPANLIDELAAHVAVALSLNYAAVPDLQRREIYAHRMDRPEAEGTASVLRFTGGPGDDYLPVRLVTVQCLTQGPTEAEALERAWLIYSVFLDGGFPARGVALPHWRLLAVDALQKPSAVGAMEGGGADVSFNWLIDAVPL